jgi:hypothetical protein
MTPEFVRPEPYRHSRATWASSLMVGSMERLEVELIGAEIVVTKSIF